MATLQDESARFLEYVSPAIAQNTIRNYRSCLRRFSRDLNGRQLTKPIVNGWILDLMKVHEMQPGTVSLYRAVLHSFFEWKGNQLVDKISVIPESQKKLEHFTEPEYLKLLAHASTDASKKKYGDFWPYALRMGWWTALRISDVSKARWNQLSWEHNALDIMPMKTRRKGISVNIPLPSEMMEFLREWRKVDPNAEYMAWEMKSLYEIKNGAFLFERFKELCAEIGITKTFKAFRHGFVTRGLAHGVPHGIISKITGQSLKTLSHYNNPTLETKRAALGYA